jgi:hypothetical protein
METNFGKMSQTTILNQFNGI